MIAATDVKFRYVRDKPLLEGVTLRVPAGSIHGVLGPNGCGKSTLLALVTGWLKPDAGRVEVLGRAIGAWSRAEFSREVALVPQFEEGLETFRVEEVVAMGRYAHAGGMIGFESPEDQRIAAGVLELVGLGGFGNRLVKGLSGGERQRVLLARALAQCPQLLLLDEPTASLDLQHQKMVFDLLRKLNKDNGLTVVLVTHDLNLAAGVCHRVSLLGHGRVLGEGTPDDLLTPQTLEAAFGVPIERIPRTGGGFWLAFQR